MLVNRILVDENRKTDRQRGCRIISISFVDEKRKTGSLLISKKTDQTRFQVTIQQGGRGACPTEWPEQFLSRSSELILIFLPPTLPPK